MDDIEAALTEVMQSYIGRVINQPMLDQMAADISRRTGLPGWATSPSWAAGGGTIFAGVRDGKKDYRATLAPGLSAKVRTITGESLE